MGSDFSTAPKCKHSLVMTVHSSSFSFFSLCNQQWIGRRGWTTIIGDCLIINYVFYWNDISHLEICIQMQCNLFLLLYINQGVVNKKYRNPFFFLYIYTVIEFFFFLRNVNTNSLKPWIWAVFMVLHPYFWENNTGAVLICKHDKCRSVICREWYVRTGAKHFCMEDLCDKITVKLSTVIWRSNVILV